MARSALPWGETWRVLAYLHAPINAKMVAFVKAWPQWPAPMGAPGMKAALGV